MCLLLRLESLSTELPFDYYVRLLLLASKTSTGDMATATMKSASVKNAAEV